MVRQRELETSKAIHRRTGRTFYLATRFLPQRVRHPTYVLYAFFRTADEVVDDAADVPPDEQRADLERLREEALGTRPPSDPVLSAFVEVCDRHDIPDAEINHFIDAMCTDIEKSRYETYDELEAYMRGSSVAVANMMLAVMDPDDPETARPHAAALGEAFQLTNFLRDVREDILERDRIYLPRPTRERHGVTDEQIVALEMSDGFAATMRAELNRTERRYRTGVAGIRYLPPDCQFPVLLAAVLYADHHRLIRNRNYDVLTGDPSLGTLRKVRLLARTRWHWRRTDDPAMAFYRSSGIDREERASHGAESGARSPVQ